MDTAECYQLLEIEPTDSFKEVKQAYRDIVFVWHPDRMTGNPRVQKKAENKLKRINVAYEHLQTYLAHETAKLTKIAIYPKEINLKFGEVYTFSAIGFDQNSNEVELEDVSWSVSGGGTMYAEGSFFADYEQGAFTVTATSEGISDKATVFVTEPMGEATKNFEQDEEEEKNSQKDEAVNSDELTPEQPEPDVGFPWKRLIFWGVITFVIFVIDFQDPDIGFGDTSFSLAFLFSLIGLIRPKAVFTFSLPNTRTSVQEIYVRLCGFLWFMSSNTELSGLTVWERIGVGFVMLGLFETINPNVYNKLGTKTRSEVAARYFIIGVILGVIWAVFKGISLLWGGISLLWGGA